MSTQPLPSFSQAFSAKSISQIDEQSNSLPPIHSRSPGPRTHDGYSPENTFARTSDMRTAMGKKRTRATENEDEQNSQSVRIKEENDKGDAVDINMDAGEDQAGRSAPAPAPPTAVKKRRMTLSGAPPLNTDIRLSSADKHSNATTPVSPVVMGFTMARDDPAALETVRSTIAVKEQQRVLIEQRRGSLQYPLPSQNSSRSANADERNTGAANKALRRSPNGSHGRGMSPPPPIPSVHLSHVSSSAANSHSPALPHDRMASTLPPPPISFAHRRANLLGSSRRRKPADILISPRSAQNQDELQPAIQSAPPVPFGGGTAMTLPRLPPMLGSDSGTTQMLAQRRTAQVPPTPGRLNRLTVHSIPGHPGRSPPTSSVPIASSLVPPTPSFLKPSFGSTPHTAAPDRDKQVFLAQFELFYDTLNDSKQLKSWLNDQLVKSAQLTERLDNTVRKYEDTIDGMRREIGGLRGRVEELEDRLHHADGPPPFPPYHPSSRRNSLEYTPSLPPKKPAMRHSPMPAPPVPQDYTFPSRRDPSSPQRDPVERHTSDLSPVPYASRRLSISSTRMEAAPRPHPGPPADHGRNTYQLMSRDREHTHLQPPPASSSSSSSPKESRPPLKRQQSNPGSGLRNRFDREDEHNQQQQRKIGVGAGTPMTTD